MGYGESRLVTQAAGPDRAGIENRRVIFVVEFSGEVGGSARLDSPPVRIRSTDDCRGRGPAP